MTGRPEPPPWGALISAALARQGLSAREAARRAGLSEGRWRQITGGYQVVSPGIYAQVRGPGRIDRATAWFERHGPAAVMERVNRGDNVDPSEYYFRTSVAFETAATKYDWLNRIIAVGTGRRPPEGPVYDVFEVL